MDPEALRLERATLLSQSYFGGKVSWMVVNETGGGTRVSQSYFGGKVSWMHLPDAGGAILGVSVLFRWKGVLDGHQG